MFLNGSISFWAWKYTSALPSISPKSIDIYMENGHKRTITQKNDMCLRGLLNKTLNNMYFSICIHLAARNRHFYPVFW